MVKNKLLLKILVSFFFALAFIFVLPKTANVWASSLILDPPFGNIASGKDLVVDIKVQGQGELIDGVDAELSYDNNFLKVKNIKEGPFFGNYPIKKDEGGQVRITALSPKDGAKIFGDIVVATVTFEVLDTGDTKVEVVYQQGATSESNITQHSTAIDLLTDVKGGSYSVVATPEKLKIAQAKKSSALSPLPFFIIILILIGIGIWYYLKKRKPKQEVFVPEAFPMDEPPKLEQ